jgi:myo-inositol-1(or 4)-monophosphatase
MQPTLDFVREIAVQAGEIIEGFVGQDLDVQHKGRTDLVTIADHAAEQYLIDAIRNSFPEHSIIAEESGQWDGSAEHHWYIDPLDGTLNYAHGVPFYSVSIGYAYEGEMQLGVVYDPTRDECFSAERGQGATLNGKDMHVSDYTNLVDCMLVTGFPNDMRNTPDDNNENFIRFNDLSQTVRRLGSAALDVVYIAAGRMDGFWEVEVFQWDVAAGGLIVREAGGVVTDIFGNQDFLKKPVSILAANPIIHGRMLDVLVEIREARSKS